MELQEHEIRHLKTLETISSECTLFLKREDESFPIDEIKDIALYGNGVRHIVKGGTGSGNVNVHFFKNVEEVFEEHGIEVTTKDWLDRYDEFVKSREKDFIKNVKKEAKENKVQPVVYAIGHIQEEGEYDFPLESKSEVCVYILTRNAGEGKDRRLIKGDYYLTDTEIKTILELNKKHEKFLLVLNVASPIELTPVLEVKNILLLSQLGSRTSETLFDIIFGYSYPSGKLASSWSNVTDLPWCNDFGHRDETNYIEGIYVGYRYFDSFDKKPTFEFGYGKGYTDFKIICSEIANDKDEISIKGEAINIGNHVGKEVIQVYLRKSTAKLENPFQILVSFYKTKALAPEEKEVFDIKFKLSDFPSFDEQEDAYILTGDVSNIAVGNSSRNLEVVASIKISKDITIKKVKHIENKLPFEELKNPHKYNLKELKDNILLTPDDFECDVVEYAPYVPRIPKFVKKLSNEQLMFLALGDIVGGLAGVIGDSCTSVLGGAGETCRKIEGLPSLAMVDGPAGLRICRDYIESDKKKYKVSVDEIFDLIMNFVPKPVSLLLDNRRNAKKKGVLKHQYCTSIPIATALAQSFNKNVLEACGYIVREEMDLFGVDLWLAPALNIHRHPLCGRNFEYYSEDPYLTGYCTTYITKAIQKNGNRGVTVKHFTCNNQETNRMNNSSNLSIRALREIYLPGFEKAVKEADPAALMISYNLINHVHTSESSFLLYDILRNEWKYDGLLMTDWIQTGQLYNKGSLNPSARASTNIINGTNLCMPGGKSDLKDIKKVFKEGRLTREQLEINATIVIHAIEKIKNIIID
ncbi:MAG: glycoside hydrolase family 3 C-terminal domain-containing protein [Bacilli bacterium]|nr:glycoside hydrolase family 3 C-terminal domain-containing protein [Bacilli bacterium]